MGENVAHINVDDRQSTGLPPVWSPSALNTFIQCPLKYWWKYAQGWKEASTIHTAAGGIVHDILEDLLRLDPGQRTVDAARDLYTVHFGRWMARGELPALTQEIAAKVGAAMTTYFDLEDPSLVEYIEGGLEMKVAGTVGGVSIGGRCDRVEYGIGAARVVDYKSGKCKPRYVTGYWRQQALYATLLDQQGIEVSEVELLYLGDPSRRMTRPVVPALLDRVETDLVQAAEQRAAFDEVSTWEARTGPLCGWCPFERACPVRASRAVPIPGTPDSGQILDRIPELTRNPAHAGNPDVVGDPEEA